MNLGKGWIEQVKHRVHLSRSKVVLKGTEHHSSNDVVLIGIESLVIAFLYGSLIVIINLFLDGILGLVAKFLKSGSGILLELSHRVSVGFVLLLYRDRRSLGSDLASTVFLDSDRQRSTVRNESGSYSFPGQRGEHGLGCRKHNGELPVRHSEGSVNSKIGNLDAYLFRSIALESTFDGGLVRNLRAARDSGKSSHGCQNE